MKKILLCILFLYSLNLIGHEVSFNYSVLEKDPDNVVEEKGWLLNFAALRWGNNDYSDYAFSILFTHYGAMLRTDLDLAWLRINIIEGLEFRVGKQYYDFGKMSASGSC